MKVLLEQVNESIRTRKLIRPGEAVLVAVSGGVDSMVLLHLLQLLAPANRWRLCVAHFNHQLRGRSADADERLVRRTAQGLGLKCVCESGDVKGHATRAGISIEMAAREMRHEFLGRVARQLKIRTIALAHHADDQVELFFLRALRGAGGEGLGGMKWRSPSPGMVGSSALKRPGQHLKGVLRAQLVRPLLDISKTKLRVIACKHHIHFREDASNASSDLQRNRIRHELLPLLRRRFQPALDKTILRVMEIVGAEAEVVTGVAQAWHNQKHRTWSDCPVGLQRRILQLQFQEHGVLADYDLIESLRVKSGEVICVAPRVCVERDEAGHLHFTAPAAIEFDDRERLVSLRGRHGKVAFAGVRIMWRRGFAEGAKRPLRRVGQESFDAEKIGLQVKLRHWRPGDRFQPIGMTGLVKLQDWFVNRKVPREHRHQRIIATTQGGEVFWVEGERIAERFKLTATTRECLVWRWERE